MPDRSTVREVARRRRLAMSELADARERLLAVHTDTDLTTEARDRRVQQLRESTAESITEEIDTILSTARRVRERRQAALDDARQVDEQAMATRAAILSPLLSKSADRPDALIEAYRERFEDPVARRLIEEAADNVKFVLSEQDRLRFDGRWQAVKAEMDSKVTGDERQALDALREVDEFDRYISGVTAQIRQLLDNVTSDNGYAIWSRPMETITSYEDQFGAAA